MSSPVELAIAELRCDGGTQLREGLDEDAVVSCAEALERGDVLPPVLVYRDDANVHWLVGGFLRVEAHLRSKRKTIAARIVPGSQRDAVLAACGENADHGLRRTNEDKRRAVVRLLNDPEWTSWNDRKIADVCRVGNKFVGDVRRSLCPDTVTATHPPEPTLRRYTTRHGTEAVMHVAKINAHRSSEEKVPEEKVPEEKKAAPSTPASSCSTTSEGASEDAADVATKSNAIPARVRKVLLDDLSERVANGFDPELLVYEELRGERLHVEGVDRKTLHRATDAGRAAWVRHRLEAIAVAEDIYAFVRPTRVEERELLGHNEDDEEAEDGKVVDTFAERVSAARTETAAAAASAAAKRAKVEAKEARRAARAAKQGST